MYTYLLLLVETLIDIEVFILSSVVPAIMDPKVQKRNHWTITTNKENLMLDLL